MAITTVRWSSIGSQEKFRSLAQATYVAPTPSTMGMVLLTPTSIAHSGTSASIGANGQVTFTAVTSLSLNGVFSAAYDNYVISIRSSSASANPYIGGRLRASGTDATATNYTFQVLYSDSTTVGGSRETSQTYGPMGVTSTSNRSGDTVHVYGPFLAQPTAWRMSSLQGLLGGLTFDVASTHSLSSSYDGVTLYPLAGNMTGAVQVYGVRS